MNDAQLRTLERLAATDEQDLRQLEDERTEAALGLFPWPRGWLSTAWQFRDPGGARVVRVAVVTPTGGALGHEFVCYGPLGHGWRSSAVCLASWRLMTRLGMRSKADEAMERAFRLLDGGA